MKLSGGQKGHALHRSGAGFTLVEVVVAAAVFLLFAVGVFSGISLVFKVVYQSRIRILETALLSERLEIARNLPYDSVGILNGVPAGLLEHTQSFTRNDMVFDVVTTVRNIDNPFDGTIGGTPNDLSPADYKLVEMSAMCQNCAQQKPVILSTIVAPKNLEGASQNGALFINVFDAAGQPVVGANVHVVNSASIPSVVIDDTTGNDGIVRIVDTPTGTLSYDVTVSKSGYSSDYTIESSADNPNPLKPPANVVSQVVTELNFAIDLNGVINLHTVNPSCAAIGNVTLAVNGEKTVGLNPSVYKFSQNITTDSSGNYTLANREWDYYHFNTIGSSYKIGGSTPMSPVYLSPGLTQDVTLVLRPYTANSLLVEVRDSGTKLPLSDTSVRLTGSGYNSTLTTDLGYQRQTDWSGGSGQAVFSIENKYWSDNGDIEKNSPAGDIKLRKSGSYYVNNGILESSTFDVGTDVTFRNIIWQPLTQPSQAGANPVLVQLATSNSSSPASWIFKGPDGSTSTYYTATNTVVWDEHTGERYFRYKIYLSTANTRYTPTVSEFSFTYTNACTPPGQVYFGSLSAGTYTLEVSHLGYTTNSGDIEVSGNMEELVDLSTVE